MEKLTTRQAKVLREIKKYIAKNGFPPTVRELCATTNLTSTATIHVHLDHLEEKGYIKKTKEKNRAIELLVPNEYDRKTDTVVSIPLLGKVTAGNPIEAIERPDDFFDVPTSLLNPRKETFSLKVSGDSMINVGIHDKDIILVERAKNASNGEIVVAMNDNNEVTVKTFYKEKDHIRLQPENDYLEPIILKNVTILGKVVGLYRKI
ncbi:MAG: transcriptional repressor LexA [bacterium]|nr:transcriptional repressor LexA [bacterium]